jgi:hypothetical protein
MNTTGENNESTNALGWGDMKDVKAELTGLGCCLPSGMLRYGYASAVCCFGLLTVQCSFLLVSTHKLRVQQWRRAAAGALCSTHHWTAVAP